MTCDTRVVTHAHLSDIKNIFKIINFENDTGVTECVKIYFFWGGGKCLRGGMVTTTKMARPKKEEKTELFAENICDIRGAANSRYVLRWTEVQVIRTNRAKSSKDKGELVDFSDKLSKRLYSGPTVGKNEKSPDAGISLPKLPTFGNATFFKEALGAAAEAARNATCRGDENGLSVVAQYTKIIAEIARSYQHYDNSLKTEEELKKLVEFHESTRKIVATEGAAGTNDSSIAFTLS
jgi:hypothetical protein